MKKQSALKRDGAPPPLYPVTIAASPFRLSSEQIARLSVEGDVVLSKVAQRDLDALAGSWIGNEQTRQSARPKEFRKIIRAIKEPLQASVSALELNPTDATTLQRHFFGWLVDHPDSAAAYLVGNAEGLIEPINKVIRAWDAVEHSLPPDSGRARPHNDTRKIIWLAEIYERAGGKAIAYRSSYTQGMANTKFWRFARAYYEMLPAVAKRTLKGFDTALVLALRA